MSTPHQEDKSNRKNNLPTKNEPTPEDLAFEAEFSKYMKEAVDLSGKANLGAAAIRGDNLDIPMNVLKKTFANKPENVLLTSPGGVTLHLLKRGANRKVEVKSLHVPDDSHLAKASVTQPAKALMEKEEQEALKRLTLQAAAAAYEKEKN